MTCNLLGYGRRRRHPEDVNNSCRKKGRRIRRHQDCLPGLNQEHSVTTNIGSLANILKEEDTNTAMSDSDPQAKGEQRVPKMP